MVEVAPSMMRQLLDFKIGKLHAVLRI